MYDIEPSAIDHLNPRGLILCFLWRKDSSRSWGRIEACGPGSTSGSESLVFEGGCWSSAEGGGEGLGMGTVIGEEVLIPGERERSEWR
jgi:hypothetical protein